MNARPWLPRRLAGLLLRHAAAVMPAQRAQWILAMRRELEYLKGDWAVLDWALGCVSASYAERMRHMTDRLLQAANTTDHEPKDGAPRWWPAAALGLAMGLTMLLTFGAGPDGTLPGYRVAFWLAWFWPVILTLVFLGHRSVRRTRQGVMFVAGVAIGYPTLLAGSVAINGFLQAFEGYVSQDTPVSYFALLAVGVVLGVTGTTLLQWGALRWLAKRPRLSLPRP
jgi:hypothetical protein